MRETTGKKAGGQEGHRGSHLSIMKDPDKIVVHKPAVYSVCPNKEKCTCGCVAAEKRRVVDANVEVSVVEHQTLEINDCPFHKEQTLRGNFPDNVRATMQYGDNLKALVVTLNTVGMVSVNRTHEILASLFGVPIATGTIIAMVYEFAERIKDTVQEIQKKVTDSPIVHFDETSTRVDGKTTWVHNSSTRFLTYLTMHQKRGAEGMEANGVLPEYKGIAVHDCWMPYWKFDVSKHALCCVHLLRELNGIEENYPDQKWASEFKKLLMDIKKAKEDAISVEKLELNEESLKKFNERYGTILAEAFRTNPIPIKSVKRGRTKRGKALALAERLAKYKESVCLFFHDFSVPFDNNQAERDVRFVKVKSKVSGCFRSNEGANAFLAIMSYVGTAKKNGINSFLAIQKAIQGNSDFIFAC